MNPFLRPRFAHSDRPRADQPQPTKDGATLRLYEPIDSWGGEWGVSAKEFVAALDELGDVPEIRLLINSPGGEVWEGLAILNSLRAHPARVVAVVEGIAASAASFIAAGVDELKMMNNAEMFVHKAWGMAIGNADDMAKMSADLTHEDLNLASIYQQKAGGTVEGWMDTMRAEAWFSAQEAVDAGLADQVVGATTGGAVEARNRFDLSVFNRPTKITIANANDGFAHQFGVRNNNPAPPEEKEGAGMPDLKTGLLERLGITDEVDDEQLLAAIDERLATPEGAVSVDEAMLDELREQARAGVEARNKQLADERAAAVTAAVNDGRIPPSRRDHWMEQLDADPGAVEALNALKPGMVPVEAKGYTGGVDEAADEDLYTRAWGQANTKEG